MTKSCPSSFFTLSSVSSTIRRGRISVGSLPDGAVCTPALFVRTSRFLPAHLTPDNLDLTIPASSSVLEMNLDFVVERGAALQACPLSLAELAGVAGRRATCLSTRVLSETDTHISVPINGDDFVTVENASGACRFELRELEGVLRRMRPDMFVVPFDAHPVPISTKRVRKAVDRTLKYDAWGAACSRALGVPMLSAIVGAEDAGEKGRGLAGVSDDACGVAFCDLHKLDLERQLALLAGCAEQMGRERFRLYRGSVSPLAMLRLLPFFDAFDTAYVDDVTHEGRALQLDTEGTGTEELQRRGQCPPLNMWDEVHFDAHCPLMESCRCPSCRGYTRAYVHHLLKSHEMLGSVLLMMHNLHQYHAWLELLKRAN